MAPDYEIFNHDYEPTEFSKSLLAGLFAGIAATVLSLIFNGYFRLYSAFPLSQIINVSTIIFALVLIVTVAGLIFYVFHHYLKKGVILYQLVFFFITMMLIVAAMQVQRSPNALLAQEFRELLYGVIAITGICTVFVVPFLFKRDYV
jgi:hypothetical protein